MGLASCHVVKRDSTIEAVYPELFIRRDGGAHGHSHPAPSSSYVEPDVGYAAPSGSPSYSAPAPSYSAPAPSYSAPSPAYGAPAPSYSAPSPAYGAPEPSYSSPATGYGPVSGYGDDGGLDLTSILIPLLALLGLSLLFPTYVSLSTVRKRRSTTDEEGKRMFTTDFTHVQIHFRLHNLDRYTNIYTTHNELPCPCCVYW